jgi:hypothetical protein
VGSARREVEWMRASLRGGLRGKKMGRVRVGRTRVTVDRLFRTAENVRRERDDMFGLTPGWSTMITASNSQTSVSDNNLVETSFKNNGGVGPVEESEPGRSRSRAPHL